MTTSIEMAAQIRIEEFIERVKQYRKDEGMTWAQLSEFCEMSEMTVQRAALGVTRMNFKTAMKIHICTGIPL